MSVSFRQHSPEDILEAVRATGLSCIEWGSDIHARCDDKAGLYKIAELQKEYGVRCSSYGTYFRLGETPIEELTEYIDAAKILGTDILRLWCGTKSGKNMTDEERNFLLTHCRTATDIAENYGMTLCMECHRDTFTENPEDAVLLMQQVNSKNFRMYWQPFQWQSFGQNLENAKKIAPFCKHIHIFNWKNEQKLPLSDAVAEWRKYLNVFPDSRTLLLEFMPNGTIQELAGEVTALRSIIGEDI